MDTGDYKLNILLHACSFSANFKLWQPFYCLMSQDNEMQHPVF